VVLTITSGTANRPPTLSVPGTQAAAVGQSISFTVSATDPDAGQVLNFSAANLPPGATFSRTGLTTAQFTYPSAAAGTYLTSFTVTDNGAPPLSDTKTVMIIIGSSNQPPIITAPNQQLVISGQPASFTVTAADADAGQTLSFSATSLPPGASFTQTGPNTAQFDWPVAVTGVYAVNLSASDSGSPPLSNTQTVRLTVINNAPILTVPGPITLGGPGALIFTVLADDPDLAHGQSLTISSPDLPPGASLIQTGPTTAQFFWPSPTPGTTVVTFIVRDNGSPSLSDVKTVVITF